MSKIFNLLYFGVLVLKFRWNFYYYFFFNEKKKDEKNERKLHSKINIMLILKYYAWIQYFSDYGTHCARLLLFFVIFFKKLWKKNDIKSHFHSHNTKLWMSTLFYHFDKHCVWLLNKHFSMIVHIYKTNLKKKKYSFIIIIIHISYKKNYIRIKKFHYIHFPDSFILIIVYIKNSFCVSLYSIVTQKVQVL